MTLRGLLAAVFALALVPYALDSARSTGVTDHAVQVAEGLLVQPDAGALEPPAVAGEVDGGYDDEPEARDEAPPIQQPRQESRQESLERPGGRQETVERGDQRQEDIEMPDGPGQKY